MEVGSAEYFAGKPPQDTRYSEQSLLHLNKSSLSELSRKRFHNTKIRIKERVSIRSQNPRTYSIQVQNAFIRPSSNLRFFSEQEVELFDSLSARELSKVLYEFKNKGYD